jgi:hypothetical protein
MSLWKGSVLRRKRFTRLHVETLEDRLTPSLGVTTTALSSAILDSDGVSKDAPIQFVDTTPIANVVQHGKADVGWGGAGTIIPGMTITSEALDTSDPTDPLAVEVGYAPDPASSDIDLAVVQLNTADGTVFNSALYNLPGSTWQAASVAVDSSGTIYAGGTLDASGMVVQIPRNLSTTNWLVTDGIYIKGVTLNAAGTNLYYTGAGVDTHPEGEVLVGKLTDLGNPVPTPVFSTLRTSTAGPSHGNGITLTSEVGTGAEEPDVAASIRIDPDPFYSNLVVQFFPDGTRKPGWRIVNADGSDIQSDFTSAATGPDGNWIAVGTIAPNAIDAVAHPMSTKLSPTFSTDPDPNVAAAHDFIWRDPSTGAIVSAWIFTYQDGFGNGISATANSVAIDAAGNYYFAGGIADPNTGSDALVAKNDGVGGATAIDGIVVSFGNADVANAIVLDTAGNAYIGGTDGGDGLAFQLINFM